jgi:hypothetical protein
LAAPEETWTLKRFSLGARGVFAKAQSRADGAKHRYVTMLHMLAAMLDIPAVEQIFVEADADVPAARAALERELANVAKASDGALSYLDTHVIAFGKSLEAFVTTREIVLADLGVELTRKPTRSLEELDRYGLNGTALDRVCEAGKLDRAFLSFWAKLPRPMSAAADLSMHRRRYPDRVQLAAAPGTGWWPGVDAALAPPSIGELYAEYNGFVLLGPRQMHVLELVPQGSAEVRGATPEVPAHLRLFLADDKQVRLPIVQEDGAWWMLLLDDVVPRGRRPFDLRALLGFAFERQEALFSGALTDALWEHFFGVS